MRRISEWIMKYKGLILYVAFGLLTTAINYVVYFPLFYIAGFSAVVSNIFSWIASVLFAFLTNKSLVFSSRNWSFLLVLHELTVFLGCRLLTGVIETVVLFVCVDFLGLNGAFWKLGLSFVIVVLNYFCSKLLVFRQNK